MHSTLRHAIYSAINNPPEVPTATFMFLPSWGRSMSTNAYMALYNQYNYMCNMLGTISSQDLKYAHVPFWNNSRTPLPKHRWDLHIIAVWNTQARRTLNNRNPEWLNHLAQSIPEVKWNMTRVSNDVHVRMLPHGAPPPGLKKFKRLKPDHILVSKRPNRDTPMHPEQIATAQAQDKSNPQLALKVTDWKKIAYTDGSCIRHDHQQIIGAGVYIPDTNTIHHVNPNGSNITNTIHRAELAAIAAAITHDHFIIATDSENSMRQIRKQIRYPELHTHHVQHHLLEAITKAARNNVSPFIKFLKVKAHTGIIGNERADQLAKHVAKHPEAADTEIRMAGHEGNPFHNITWLATSTDVPNTQSPTTNNNHPQPHQLQLRYLPNKRDAL